MDTLIDTRHYCDTATTTPAKAKKNGCSDRKLTPPDGWCNGNDRDWHEKMKGYILRFYGNATDPGRCDMSKIDYQGTA